MTSFKPFQNSLVHIKNVETLQEYTNYPLRELQANVISQGNY